MTATNLNPISCTDVTLPEGGVPTPPEKDGLTIRQLVRQIARYDLLFEEYPEQSPAAHRCADIRNGYIAAAFSRSPQTIDDYRCLLALAVKAVDDGVPHVAASSLEALFPGAGYERLDDVIGPDPGDSAPAAETILGCIRKAISCERPASGISTEAGDALDTAQDSWIKRALAIEPATLEEAKLLIACIAWVTTDPAPAGETAGTLDEFIAERFYPGHGFERLLTDV